MDNQDVREELSRILGHPKFAAAGRLSRFLEFVLEKKLAGEADEIKEYLIALEVYQRKPDYDPQSDSIVRVEASRLRSRLREYYATAGAASRVRITLPKGSYVPEFELVDAATVAELNQVPGGEEARQPGAPGEAYLRRPWVGAGLLAVSALAAFGFWRWKAEPPQPGRIGSLAVLPFVNLGSGPDDERIADGLTEELTTLAARFEGINVAARTSSYQFKNKAVNVSDAGRELGVEAVIEGSVRREGDRFRVTAQLIQVSDGYHLWAQSFEWETADTMSFEKQAAASIARDVDERLSGASPWRATGRGPRDPELFRRYLEAHDLVDKREIPLPWPGRIPEYYEKAARILEEVTAADPQFAAAWAYLGIVYERSIDFDAQRATELIEKARTACRKALALDENRGDAHYTLGTILFYRLWDFDAAVVEMRRSVEIDPRDPYAQSELADLLRITGHKDEALVEITRALTFDPSSPQLEFQIGLHMVDRKDYGAAMQHASRALTLRADYVPAMWLEGIILEQQQRWDDAEARYRQALEIRPEDTRALPALGYLLAKTNRRQEAQEILVKLKQQQDIGRSIDYWVALIQLGLGDREGALAALELAYERHDQSTPYIGVDPRLEPLMNEPRFIALKERLKLG